MICHKSGLSLQISKGDKPYEMITEEAFKIGEKEASMKQNKRKPKKATKIKCFMISPSYT